MTCESLIRGPLTGAQPTCSLRIRARLMRRAGQALLLSALLAGCGDDGGGGDSDAGDEEIIDPVINETYRLERLFPSDANPEVERADCIWGSPVLWSDGESERLLSLGGDGQLLALDPTTGQRRWTVALPAPEGERPLALSQPILLAEEGLLVAAYMTTPADHGGVHDANAPRLSHRVAVIDLAGQRLDPAFEVLVLEATVEGPDGPVSMRPGSFLTRPDLARGLQPGQALGTVYVTGGNTRDIQPWHGWAFEVDLDRWRDEGADAALTGVLLTTPEVDASCGPQGSSGSRERLCGGGLWAPSGPLIVPEAAGGYHLILAPGNGQLDLARRDYANTLMKVGPGLAFEPGCDASACAGFDPDAPDPTCAASCEALFIPRLMPDQPLPDPGDGRCDGLTLFECWQTLDYIGGSTPARVEREGRALLIYPTKDGSAFLVDGDHLGTLHDRHVLVETCGAPGDPCRLDWAGMAVTQPLVAPTAAGVVIMIPTFMPDQTHDAGVVAVGVSGDAAAPRLERLWEYPPFGSEAARTRFRTHPSRMALSPDGARAWIVEVNAVNDRGRLVALDVATGEPFLEATLVGSGQRYTVPLVVGERVYVTSCDGNGGPGHVEGYEVIATRVAE